MFTTQKKTKPVGPRAGSDDYNTPENAWEDIMDFVGNQEVHMPFYNDGLATVYLKKLGVNYKHADRDFFDYYLKNQDGSPMLVVDNPPYTIKEKIIETLYNRKGQSFALLLPIDTLGRVYMKKFQKNFQLVIPHETYGFYSSNGYKASPSKTGWFCWRMSPILKTSQKLIRLDKRVPDKWFDAVESNECENCGITKKKVYDYWWIEQKNEKWKLCEKCGVELEQEKVVKRRRSKKTKTIKATAPKNPNKKIRFSKKLLTDIVEFSYYNLAPMYFIN